MSRSTKLALGFLLISIGQIVDSSAAAPPEKSLIRIGHREKPAKGAAGRDFAPLLAHLNKSDRYVYEVHPFASADDLYEAFRRKAIHVALLGPVYYVRAHHEFGAEAILAEGATYHSVIVVKKDSPIRRMEDLRGKRFAFGYPESTSSHFYPLLLLSKARLKESDLGARDFVGGHKAVVEAILSGSFDAGGVIEGEFEQNKGRGLRLLARSDPIPGVPLVVHKDVDPSWIQTFKKSLLEHKPLSPGSVTEAFSSGAFAVSDKDYNQIRFLSKVLLGKDYK